MFSWIITGIGIGVGLGLIYLGIKTDNNDEGSIGCFIVGGFITVILVGCVVASWHYDFLGIPAHYQRINTNIQEIKQVITNKELNLADMEMHKELASLIKEKNELLTIVKVNNKSPFAYFKIQLEK